MKATVGQTNSLGSAIILTKIADLFLEKSKVKDSWKIYLYPCQAESHFYRKTSKRIVAIVQSFDRRNGVRRIKVIRLCEHFASTTSIEYSFSILFVVKFFSLLEKKKKKELNLSPPLKFKSERKIFRMDVSKALFSTYARRKINNIQLFFVEIFSHEGEISKFHSSRV